MAVDNTAAALLHLHVGSVLPMTAFQPDPSKNVRKLTERVVGIFVASDSIVAVNDLANSARILASAALYRELGPAYWAFDGAYLTLKPGATVTALTAEAEGLAKRYKSSTGGQVFVSDQTVQAATVERAIRPQAVALALFALALALTALLVVGQVAVRLLIGAAGDNASLAALGMTRRQLLAAGLAEVAVPVAAGAVLAVVIAIAASPLTPIGPARLAEPHPGFSANVTLLGIGFAAIVVLLLVRVAVTAWRQASVRAAIGSLGSAVAGGPGPPSPARRAACPGRGAARGGHRRPLRA